MSYTTFCHLKPFWVVQPKATDRDTCVCKQHEHIQYMMNSLYKVDVLSTAYLQYILKSSVCVTESIDCMYGKCDKCKMEIIDINVKGFDGNDEISWYQWFTTKEQRNMKNQEKEITITVKEEQTGRLNILVDKFSEEINRYERQVFSIKNQHRHYRDLKGNLKVNEAMIHIDFSGHYACKLSTKIQSMHFGTSQKQLTLHIGVYYTGKEKKAC